MKSSNKEYKNDREKTIEESKLEYKYYEKENSLSRREILGNKKLRIISLYNLLFYKICETSFARLTVTALNFSLSYLSFLNLCVHCQYLNLDGKIPINL